MRAALGMPEGRAKLAQLLEQFPDDHPHWSEAENRFQFIDEFMKECLGWQKPDMHVEVSQEGGGRSDYELGTPAKGILEAKKPALVWTEVPDASKKKLRSIEALCFSSPEFAAAASQILPYCVRKGAPLAVICNGPQMAIFQGICVCTSERWQSVAPARKAKIGNFLLHAGNR